LQFGERKTGKSTVIDIAFGKIERANKRFLGIGNIVRRSCDLRFIECNKRGGLAIKQHARGDHSDKKRDRNRGQYDGKTGSPAECQMVTADHSLSCQERHQRAREKKSGSENSGIGKIKRGETPEVKREEKERETDIRRHAIFREEREYFSSFHEEKDHEKEPEDHSDQAGRSEICRNAYETEIESRIPEGRPIHRSHFVLKVCAGETVRPRSKKR